MDQAARAVSCEEDEAEEVKKEKFVDGFEIVAVLFAVFGVLALLAESWQLALWLSGAGFWFLLSTERK